MTGTIKRWTACIVLIAAGGCSMQLETGYKYRPLNASPTQRRAYYAGPYTPEAAAAQHENGGESRFHKPGE